MRTTRTTPRLVRAAARIALCYVLALQAFLAAHGAAFAAVAAAQGGAGLVICHSGGGPTAPDPAERPVAHLPCALCAIAASAGGLPAAANVLAAAAWIYSHRVAPAEIAAVVAFPLPRAGFARAPPRFA